ncbi:MAG: NAD-dependent epimerase/dehydratase family protein [Candidatus Sumerlaeaceae bacterium]|nr:NAD-dependent epimerase/dehydratase family protein [Candidatus Sumerlaeaceae bacterium]
MTQTILVTGGGGFIGRAIVLQLLARQANVRVYARGSYPELASMGVHVIHGDVADLPLLARSCKGCETVFHAAARVGLWGPRVEFVRANINGTENVISACRRAGVPKLVFTSSPSAVFDGSPLEGVNESVPYPSRPFSNYGATKAAAEQLVLGANGPSLRTTALRPHFVWGPGDQHILPRFLERARSGKVYLIGGGTQLVDCTYVDNVAEAHLLAESALGRGVASGKAYFISQGHPIAIREMMERTLAAAHLSPRMKSLSPSVAFAVAGGLELLWRLPGFSGEPPLTTALAHELAVPHWFDISAARRDLGYAPRIGIDEGFGRLERWLKTQAVT